MASSTPDFIATYLPIPSLPLDWLLDIRVKRLYGRYLYTFGLDDGLHKLVTKNSGGLKSMINWQRQEGIGKNSGNISMDISVLSPTIKTQPGNLTVIPIEISNILW